MNFAPALSMRLRISMIQNEIYNGHPRILVHEMAPMVHDEGLMASQEG
jgi:hypothetical protein